MSDYDFLSVSDGSGDASLMHVTGNRVVGATVISVDVIAGVPSKFVATSGTLLPSGFIDPATKTDFKGHVSGGTLVIDAFEPGSTDLGNTTGQVVIIKPNTGWANRVAQFIKNATGFGTPEAVTFAAITAASQTLSGNSTVGGNSSVTGNEDVTGNFTGHGTSRLLGASVVTADGSNNITPTSQEFEVTALAHDATIIVPSYTPQNMMSGSLKIKDDGNIRNLTWPAGWVPFGVTLPAATVAGKWFYISYKYSSADSKFHVLGIARQP